VAVRVRMFRLQPAADTETTGPECVTASGGGPYRRRDSGGESAGPFRQKSTGKRRAGSQTASPESFFRKLLKASVRQTGSFRTGPRMASSTVFPFCDQAEKGTRL
jgi:hypothetical protein